VAGLGRNTLDCCRPEACFCESSTSALLAPTRESVTSTRPSSPQGDTSFVFLALRQLVLARLRLRPSPNCDGGAQIRVTTDVRSEAPVMRANLVTSEEAAIRAPMPTISVHSVSSQDFASRMYGSDGQRS
jgi:hypothetical protein